MAWQTPIVFVIAIANTAIALIVSNTGPLGITNPWLTIVVIPTAVFSLTLAANQLKTIGSSDTPVNGNKRV